MTIEQATVQERYGSNAEWATANPVLLPGEAGVTTEGVTKHGDGITPWNDLQVDNATVYATRSEYNELEAEVATLGGDRYPDGTNAYQAVPGGPYVFSGRTYVGPTFPPAPFPNGSLYLKPIEPVEGITATHEFHLGINNEWTQVVFPGGSTEPPPPPPPPPPGAGYEPVYPTTY